MLTRDAAIEVLAAVACAPLKRTVRGIRSEVELGTEHGLPERCVISCDNVITIPLNDLDDEPVGHLDEVTRVLIDQALRYALDVGQSTISHHLAKLAHVGFVLVDHVATSSLWRVNAACLAAFPSVAEIVMGRIPAEFSNALENTNGQ